MILCTIESERFQNFQDTFRSKTIRRGRTVLFRIFTYYTALIRKYYLLFTADIISAVRIAVVTRTLIVSIQHAETLRVYDVLSYVGAAHITRGIRKK